MPEAFDYRPIGFLEKPVTIEKIRALINRFCFYHWHDGKYFVVRSKNNALRVAHRQIAYFASENHRINLVLTNGETLRFKGKLDDIERELAQYPYVRCHKSFLVRLDEIEQMDRSKQVFILKNGMRTPISKAYYQEAARRFLLY